MAYAFKEWALVCEALGDGRQCILLRKGGIAEGREGFAFRHEEFALFPTWFHEQLGKTRLPEGTLVPPEPEGEVMIEYVATVEWSWVVREREKLAALREFHILADEVVEERFGYGGEEGLHVAAVRVYRLEPPMRVVLDRKHGGCRSWVEVPDWEGAALVSVLSDEEHERRMEELRRVLG